ncbi:hypothetical protein G6F57_016942 [Rhizopus arrhizus]|nr:hypothetical protein G6F57_016942 [Rhizopus arrhizus]
MGSRLGILISGLAQFLIEVVQHEVAGAGGDGKVDRQVPLIAVLLDAQVHVGDGRRVVLQVEHVDLVG